MRFAIDYGLQSGNLSSNSFGAVIDRNVMSSRDFVPYGHFSPTARQLQSLLKLIAFLLDPWLAISVSLVLIECQHIASNHLVPDIS